MLVESEFLLAMFGWQGNWRILPGNQSIVYLSSTEWNGRENLLIEFLDVFSKVYFVQLNVVSVSFLGNVSTHLA